MLLFRTGCLFVVSAFGLLAMGHAQDEKPLPSDDEIKFMLTQADRAMQQYELAVEQEKTVMGQVAADAVAKDEEVTGGWRLLSGRLKTQPQEFNGVLGFELILSLDDANRNLLVCSEQALSLAVEEAMKGELTPANEHMHLAQTCADAGPLLYTVSESASKLYEKYLLAEEQFARKAEKALTRCRTLLEKKEGLPKP